MHNEAGNLQYPRKLKKLVSHHVGVRSGSHISNRAEKNKVGLLAHASQTENERKAFCEEVPWVS